MQNTFFKCLSSYSPSTLTHCDSVSPVLLVSRRLLPLPPFLGGSQSLWCSCCFITTETVRAARTAAPCPLQTFSAQVWVFVCVTLPFHRAVVKHTRWPFYLQAQENKETRTKNNVRCFVFSHVNSPGLPSLAPPLATLSQHTAPLRQTAVYCTNAGHRKNWPGSSRVWVCPEMANRNSFMLWLWLQCLGISGQEFSDYSCRLFFFNLIDWFKLTIHLFYRAPFSLQLAATRHIFTREWRTSNYSSS